MPDFALEQIAALIGADVQGDINCRVQGIAPIQSAKAGELTFVINKQYCKYLSSTAASAVILAKEYAARCQPPALLVDSPKQALITLLNVLYPKKVEAAAIHPTAIIAPDCEIGEKVSIGPHCIIASGVKIGSHSYIGAGSVLGAGAIIGMHSYLHARVVLYSQVRLGDRVIIHSGVVIGADGFGFADVDHRWIKIPQIASVLIGNDVEIGANTTIDCGMLNDTIIGDGVKIDNLVQIAHNVTIGEHTIIAGCAAIAGSTQIGAHCMIGGGACIADHLEITDHVVIGGMGAVGQSIKEPGVYSSGINVLENKEWRRNTLRFQQLDEMAKRIRKLEKSNNADGCRNS